jgi:hypothetical protein
MGGASPHPIGGSMEKPSSIKKGLAGGPHPIIKGAIVHRRGAFDLAAAVGAPVFAVWILGQEAPLLRRLN